MDQFDSIDMNIPIARDVPKSEPVVEPWWTRLDPTQWPKWSCVCGAKTRIDFDVCATCRAPRAFACMTAAEKAVYEEWRKVLKG